MSDLQVNFSSDFENRVSNASDASSVCRKTGFRVKKDNMSCVDTNLSIIVFKILPRLVVFFAHCKQHLMPGCRKTPLQRRSAFIVGSLPHCNINFFRFSDHFRFPFNGNRGRSRVVWIRRRAIVRVRIISGASSCSASLAMKDIYISERRSKLMCLANWMQVKAP